MALTRTLGGNCGSWLMVKGRRVGYVGDMKRGRSASKSTSSDSGVKDEPTKKQKKRIKVPAAQSSVSVPLSSPVQLKPPKSCAKLGSLPMYGEQIPEDGFDSIPKLAEKTCSEIRTVMLKVKEIKSAGDRDESELAAHKQKGLVNFVNLKKLNRLSHMYCKDAREQTHEQKLGADDLHLQLQNLMYEAMHLRKEITNCLEFKSQHEDIELIGEEELLLTSASQELPADEHDGMLKRLEWELQERKKLAEQQSGLEILTAKEEKDIQMKEENLSRILPTLEGIRKATLPLQESLGITLDKKREEQEIAVLLPSALYVFFMQAKVFADIQDSSLSVSVTGDVDEAKSFQSSELENSDEDSGDSDNEGDKTRSRRKKHRRVDKSAVEKKISKAHPLSIVCKITLEDLGSFEVTFSYLPYFSVVCASVTSVTMTRIPEDLLNVYFDKSCLLHSLVDSDTGRTSPNALVSFHIRKQGNDVFSSAVRTYGFPYKWVQRVCGINDSVEVEVADATLPQQQVEVSAENIGHVVDRLKQRFQSQAYLVQQLIGLGSEMTSVPLMEILQEIKKSSCKLSSWKLTPSVELQSALSGFVSQSIFNAQERMNKFYHGMFHYEMAVLECIVCVGADYPVIPPIFAISIKYCDEDFTQNIQIKSIEADVNVHIPKALKSIKDSGKHLLFKQIQRLQNCFQVFMEHKKQPAIPRKSIIRGKGRLVVLKK